MLLIYLITHMYPNTYNIWHHYNIFSQFFILFFTYGLKIFCNIL